VSTLTLLWSGSIVSAGLVSALTGSRTVPVEPPAVDHDA